MAEVVKAWGSEYGSYEKNAEKKAESSAVTAVQCRLHAAGHAPIDDIVIVKTKTRDSYGTTYYSCQAAVRAVRK